MEDSARAYQRDVRGRFTRPVANVDAESKFGPMGNSIEDIKNVSADDVRPGMEIPRYAPAGDDLAQGDAYPPGVRTARMVPPVDGTSKVYAVPREATLRRAVTTAEAGRALPDELQWLLGSLDGSDSGPEPLGVSATVYGDGGQVMSPTRAEDVAPGRGRRRGDGR